MYTCMHAHFVSQIKEAWRQPEEENCVDFKKQNRNKNIKITSAGFSLNDRNGSLTSSLPFLSTYYTD